MRATIARARAKFAAGGGVSAAPTDTPQPGWKTAPIVTPAADLTTEPAAGPWTKYAGRRDAPQVDAALDAAPMAAGPWTKYQAPGTTPPPHPVSASPVPEAHPGNANSQGWLDYANDLTQKMAQGITFNMGDELAAAAGSLGGLGPLLLGTKTRQQILDDVRGREKAFEAANPKTALAAEIGGSVLTGTGGAGLAARAIPALARSPRLVRNAVGAMTAAAPMGAANEVGKIEGDKSLGEYAQAAGEGAMTAAAFAGPLSVAGGTLARVAGPWATEAARRLAARGIRLSPGQLLGPNAKRLEDAATSLPGLNMLLRNRRADTLEDLNRVAVNVGLNPIGATLGHGVPVGHDAIAAAGDEISAAYQAAVPQLRGIWDAPLQRTVATITNTLPRDQQQAFGRFVSREIDNVTNGQGTGGAIAGDDMQHLIGTLRAEANHLTSSPTASHHDRELGRAFGLAADAVHQNMSRHSPQAAVDAFNAADAAFARLVRLEKAAGMSDEGIFTPHQLKNAVRASDRSSRKRNVGRGEALMQGLSTDAKVAIGNTLADSGTPERMLLSTLITGGGAMMLSPKLLLGPAALAGLYTRTGNRLFQGAATASPATRSMIRRAIERATAAGAPAGGLAASDRDGGRP